MTPLLDRPQRSFTMMIEVEQRMAAAFQFFRLFEPLARLSACLRPLAVSSHVPRFDFFFR